MKWSKNLKILNIQNEVLRNIKKIETKKAKKTTKRKMPEQSLSLMDEKLQKTLIITLLIENYLLIFIDYT